MSVKKSLIISFLLVVVGVAGRFLPHLPNATPITAIALFSATYLGLRYSWSILIVTMLITDAFIGFYDWKVMAAVYGSLILSAIIGLLVRKYKTAGTKIVFAGSVFFGTLASSLLFFLITNWAVWQFGMMYVHSWQGLMESYAMAIPFFKNSLLGDLTYTATLFGAFETARYAVSQKIKIRSAVRSLKNQF